MCVPTCGYVYVSTGAETRAGVRVISCLTWVLNILNSDPWEEQQILLTIERSLEP